MIKEIIAKKLKKSCAVCGKSFLVQLYANRKYRGGHYFGKILDFKNNSKEYWECPKCYKGK